MKSANQEMELIHRIAGGFPRYPQQVNSLFDADAEIIPLSQFGADHLVIKTDGIHEEIKEKLYEDPYLIGWMAVTVTMSDMAATGATPFGVLLSVQLPKTGTADWLPPFQQGIGDACQEYGIYVLGGDTNFADIPSVTTTGIATVKGTRLLQRKTISPGELLYCTGFLGSGNGFAYNRFFDPAVKAGYFPKARLKESKIIRAYATACIDTSDGLFAALSVLAEVNQKGFSLTTALQDLLPPDTSSIQQQTGLPAWIFLAGPHGEYELVFSIPPALQNTFEDECKREGWKPLLLGEVIAGKELSFCTEGLQVTCSPSAIANLYAEADGNIQQYFTLLMEKHHAWAQPKTETVC